jgi:hypothetical protein
MVDIEKVPLPYLANLLVGFIAVYALGLFSFDISAFLLFLSVCSMGAVTGSNPGYVENQKEHKDPLLGSPDSSVRFCKRLIHIYSVRIVIFT